MYKQINNDQCIKPSTLPRHTINVGGDLNKIALDTAIGGCFGETISALTMINNSNKYKNIIDKFVYEIVMDEINHSSLAWITVKWIIDQQQTNDITIANQEWWFHQLLIRKRKTNINYNENYVYETVIPSILNKIWVKNNLNYQQIYHQIVNELKSHLSVVLGSTQYQCSM